MSNTFTLDELNALTETYVLGQPNDIYFASHPLFEKLKGKVRTVPGGLYIDVPLEHGEANSGRYGNTTEIPGTKTETHNKAQFEWGGYFAAQTVDLDDRVKNNGEAAIINLVAAKFGNMQKTIRKKMSAGVYLDEVTGISDPGFSGLAAIFNTGTSVAYGGITEANVSIWKANSSATATVATYQGFQAIRLPAIVDTNMEGMPDLYVTTQTILDGFDNSLGTKVRYSDQKLVDSGFNNIKFGGAPVVADLGQAAGYVDALNTRYLQLVAHTDFNFTTPKWEVLSQNRPDIWTANIRFIGQLTCSHRKAHSRFTNVSAPV